MKVRQTHHLWESDLFDAYSERSAFRQEFEVTQEGALLVDFKCEVKHRGLVNGVIMASARVKYRTASTQAGLSSAPLNDIAGCVGGGNILNIEHHYDSPSFSGTVPIAPGWYRLEVWMSSNTTIPHTNGTCARISNQSNPAADAWAAYNVLRSVELPGATVMINAA